MQEAEDYKNTMSEIEVNKILFPPDILTKAIEHKLET